MDTAQTQCGLHGRAVLGGSAQQGNGYRTNLLQLAWKSCVGGFSWAGLLPMGNYNTYDITACHSTMDFPQKIHAAQTQYGSIPAEVQLLRKCCLGGFGSAGIVDMGSGTHSEMYFPWNMDTAPTHCGLCGRAASGGLAWRVEWVQKMDTAQTWYGSIPAAVRLVWKSCLGWFGLAGLVAMGSGTHSEMYYPREMDAAQTRCGLCERAAVGGSAWQVYCLWVTIIHVILLKCMPHRPGMEAYLRKCGFCGSAASGGSAWQG
ncbi:hypothetical protein EDD15DRAFT_2203051 [Pisolithus albus]|nr:hypothetical protein EDD15DRAFT_2203051 [Pisolithus albus]